MHRATWVRAARRCNAASGLNTIHAGHSLGSSGVVVDEVEPVNSTKTIGSFVSVRRCFDASAFLAREEAFQRVESEIWHLQAIDLIKVVFSDTFGGEGGAADGVAAIAEAVGGGGSAFCYFEAGFEGFERGFAVSVASVGCCFGGDVVEVGDGAGLDGGLHPGGR